MDAFDTGANIKVVQDGLYRLTLTTDVETLSLCKIAPERIGEAAEPPVAACEFDLVKLTEDNKLAEPIVVSAPGYYSQKHQGNVI